MMPKNTPLLVALFFVFLLIAGCTSTSPNEDREITGNGPDSDPVDSEDPESESEGDEVRSLSRLEWYGCIGAVGQLEFRAADFQLPLPDGFTVWTGTTGGQNSGRGVHQFFGLDCESVKGDEGSEVRDVTFLFSRVRVIPGETYLNESIDANWLLLRTYATDSGFFEPLEHWNLSTFRHSDVRWSDTQTPVNTVSVISYQDEGYGQEVRIVPHGADVALHLAGGWEYNFDWDGESRITVLATHIISFGGELGGAELSPDEVTGLPRIAGLGVRFYWGSHDMNFAMVDATPRED